MRFETATPASRLLRAFFPWMKGRRPAWMIRLGLFLYDHLGGRRLLPGTATLDLRGGPEGAPLKPEFVRAFEYSDCWVEDARLVVLNARDAAERGAAILVRTRVIAARRSTDGWEVTVRDSDTGEERTIRARALVNAAGPWVAEVASETLGGSGAEPVRLVRGSHIVTRRLFDHGKCYFLQGSDGRIVFAIPFESDFTLIGTTDADHPAPSVQPECSVQERQYLLDFVNRYLRRPVGPGDIVWSYAGVRPLHDAGGGAAAATRDYLLKLDTRGVARPGSVA